MMRWGMGEMNVEKHSDTDPFGFLPSVLGCGKSGHGFRKLFNF